VWGLFRNVPRWQRTTSVRCQREREANPCRSGGPELVARRARMRRGGRLPGELAWYLVDLLRNAALQSCQFATSRFRLVLDQGRFAGSKVAETSCEVTPMRPSAARAARPRTARTLAAYGLTKVGIGGAPPGMVWVPGGELTMGCDAPHASRAEGPAHRVRVDGLWMDEIAVTNAQFRAFAGATGHVTMAERPHGLHPRHRHVARRFSLRPGRGYAGQGEVTDVRPRSIR
jgi:hypothetical protein